MTTGQVLAVCHRKANSELLKIAAPPVASPFMADIGGAISKLFRDKLGVGAEAGFNRWWSPLARGNAFKKYMLPGLIAGGVGGVALSD